MQTSLQRLATHHRPIFTVENKAADTQYYIDQPRAWESLPRCVIIRGWCFATANRPIQGIRLRTPNLCFSGVIGMSRPDVKAALKDAPDDNTGFEVRCVLPAGRIDLIIETLLADGSWQALLSRAVDVQRRWLPLWLGGGAWTELMFFQMPAHMAYPPCKVQLEVFPVRAQSTRRPKLSIVTPSYEQARFLEQTMLSVLEQPMVACDYVVQDGGSADGSKAIIERFAQEQETGRREQGDWGIKNGRRETASRPKFSTSIKPRLAAWASEPDQGQADAIAKGFAKTAGSPDDLMAWINSDDFYLPGALAYVVDYFARHPAADVLYGHRIVVNEESREIARWFLPKHDDEVLRLNDFVPQETMFWRRRIWDKVGGLDHSLKFAMDWDLLLRFQAAGARIVRVPYFLACFRVHPAQKTSAAMHTIGQREINVLRERTQGRPFPPHELENDPRLIRYLRKSAFLEFMWKLGVRLG